MATTDGKGAGPRHVKAALIPKGKQARREAAEDYALRKVPAHWKRPALSFAMSLSGLTSSVFFLALGGQLDGPPRHPGESQCEGLTHHRREVGATDLRGGVLRLVGPQPLHRAVHELVKARVEQPPGNQPHRLLGVRRIRRDVRHQRGHDRRPIERVGVVARRCARTRMATPALYFVIADALPPPPERRGRRPGTPGDKPADTDILAGDR